MTPPERTIEQLQAELDAANTAWRRTLEQAQSAASRLNKLERLHGQTISRLTKATRLLTICIDGNPAITGRNELAIRELLTNTAAMPKPRPSATWPTQAAVEAAHWAMHAQLVTVNEDTGQYEPVEDEEAIVRRMLEAAGPPDTEDQ